MGAGAEAQGKSSVLATILVLACAALLVSRGHTKAVRGTQIVYSGSAWAEDPTVRRIISYELRATQPILRQQAGADLQAGSAPVQGAHYTADSPSPSLADQSLLPAFATSGEGLSSRSAADPRQASWLWRERVQKNLTIEWLHIPKAGTSFGNTVLLWACPDLPEVVLRPGNTSRLWITPRGVARQLPEACRAKFLHPLPRYPTGNTWVPGNHWALANRTEDELRSVVALVRSPATRLASGFHYRTRYRRLNASLDEICEHASSSTYAHSARGVQVKLIAGDPSFSKSWRYTFDSPALPSEEMVQEACRRVRLFSFVGISDFWAASICLFHAMHGGPTYPTELANVREGNYSSVPGSVKEALCGDSADARLFECAMEVFLERLRQHPQCQDLLPEGSAAQLPRLTNG